MQAYQEYFAGKLNDRCFTGNELEAGLNDIESKSCKQKVGENRSDAACDSMYGYSLLAEVIIL